VDQPRWVMLRSLVLPAWGQYHNRAYGKAAALFAVEGYLIGRILADESRLGRLQARHRPGPTGARRCRQPAGHHRVQRAPGRVRQSRVAARGVVAYAMLDAYVDAYFVDFDVQFKHDPALQGSLPIPACSWV